VEPVVGQNFHRNHLALVVASECVVGDDHIDAAAVAIVFIAARAPVLPESDLPTRAFLPHGACVVKAPRPLAVTLQSKVFLLFWQKMAN
jgi:hypothetical protein